MKKNIFEPLNLLHYFLLVGFIILGYYISDWLGIMDMGFTDPLAWIYLILVFFVVLFIGDSFIHYILNYD